MDLRAHGVGVCVGDRWILKNLDLEVAKGDIVGLVGPNGSGKTTALRTIYRALQPRTGTIELGRQPLRSWSVKQYSRQVAAVSQHCQIDFDFTVRDIVAMGRTPHKAMFARDNSQDVALIESSIERVGLADMRNRCFSTLSGGERQRCLIARAIAQEAGLVVLDEPTNHLDIRYQLDVMELVRSLGLAVILAIHDLNIAAAYCTTIILLSNGQVVATGSPDEVLRPALLEEVFDVAVTAVRHPVHGRPQLLFDPGKSANIPDS